MKSRLYFCEGYCRITGKVCDLIEAAGFGDAKTRFYLKHRVQATHVSLEK